MKMNTHLSGIKIEVSKTGRLFKKLLLKIAKRSRKTLLLLYWFHMLTRISAIEAWVRAVLNDVGAMRRSRTESCRAGRAVNKVLHGAGLHETQQKVITTAMICNGFLSPVVWASKANYG